MGDYAYLLMKTILALGLVVVLILGTMYAFRLVQGRGYSSGRGFPIRVLARGFLGQKGSLVVVEVAGEVLVLGISPGAVNLLLRIDDEEVISGLRSRAGARPVVMGARWWARLLGGAGKAGR